MSLIRVDNVVYVTPGSKDDNGTYDHYFRIEYKNATYNILYKGELGTITTKKEFYYEYNSNTLLKVSPMLWTMKTASINKTDVCRTETEEQAVLVIIDRYKVEGNTSDKSNEVTHENDIPVENPENVSSGNDNTEDKSNHLNDIPVDSVTDTSVNVISHTLGSNTEGDDKKDLVLGMDYTDATFATNPDISENPNKDVGTNVANKGTVAPVIRINENMFYNTEIQYFSMETGFRKNYKDYLTYKQPESGFLPTMELHLNVMDKSMLKTEIVKNGDRCSVFFTTGHKMIKSMRCDFRITNVITSEMNLTKGSAMEIRYIVYGELYVPNLRNEKVRYNWNGTSRDGLMDAAKRLKLSFHFCDPENTDDLMVWCCCKTPIDFIKDLTVHAWKNDKSFFESWIDPKYAISFLNINKLLGEKDLDEPIDYTIFNKAFMNYISTDGNKALYTEKETVNTDIAQYKIMSNIPTDDSALSPYYITSWRLHNKALEIQDFIGLNCKMLFDSNNAGMDGNSKYAVDTTICINRTKCPEDGKDAKFYVLLGPGRSDSYENADLYMGVSETQSSNNVAPEIITLPMSDQDALNIVDTDGNMLSSGNTHKFYEVAYQHNMRNLLQLLKQYITCVLNGANLSIVRGEKIPVILMDHDKANAYVRSGKSILLSEVLYETESGWYIIDGIEWVFDPYNTNSLGTAWTTHVNLTKREWPIPGITDQKFHENDLVIVDTGNGENVVLGYQDAVAKYGRDHVKRGYDPKLDKNDSSVIELDPLEVVYPTKNGIESDVEIDLDEVKESLNDVVEEPKSNTNDNTTNIPLTGLKDYMKLCYQLIASKVNIKLVGAKRWAVNEEGMKVEGNAFVKNHGYYKCVNTMNEILYFKQSNSKHLYGEAIDIINVEGSTDFNKIMTDVIMKDPDILTHMYNNGLSAYIEQGEDDNGVITKHYHIGTDTIKLKEFWNSVKAINKSTIIPGTYIDFQDYLSKNRTTIEITRNPVNEVTTT